MRENLPKEIDFVHEAANARQAIDDFKNTTTSLYIPRVLSATKRILVMELIKGGRVDDLEYVRFSVADLNRTDDIKVGQTQY